MDTNTELELEGLTIDAAGKPASADKEALLKKQKARAKASGIAPKDGGSLTMPKAWRGVVPDNNESWGDWTNYRFPIHDLAHANNAAARLAQNSGYSSEEKSKISSRIEKAQKKHGAKKFKNEKSSLIVEEDECAFVVDAAYEPEVKHNQENPNNAPDSNMYTKEEVHAMMGDMMDHIYSTINQLHQMHSARVNRVVGAVNDYIEQHGGGHLPKMDKGQIKKVLDAAGILDDFNDVKPPLEEPSCGIYASMSDKEKIEIGKFNFKVK